MANDTPEALKAKLEELGRIATKFGETMSGVTTKMEQGWKNQADLVSKLSDSISKLDMSSMSKAFESISGSVTTWQEGTSHIIDDMRSISTQHAEVNKLMADSSLILKDQAILNMLSAALRKQETEEQKKLLENADSMFTKAKRFLEIKREELALDHQIAMSRINTTDEFGRGLADAEGSLKNLMNFVTSLPGGGILAFFLMGIAGEQGFLAQANSIRQNFNAIGGAAGDTLSKLDSMLHTGAANLNMSAAEMQAAVHNMVQAGIKDTKMLDAGFLELGEGGLLRATIAMDHMMKVSAGTFGGMIGAAVKDLGANVKDATIAMIGYGQEVAKAGINSIQFLNAVTQSMQAVKLYGMNIRDVTHWTKELVEANVKHGQTQAFATTIAGQGMSQMMSGIAGMGEGLAAFIAQRAMTGISGREGMSNEERRIMSGDAVTAMMELKHGFRDLSPERHREANTNVVMELAKLSGGAGADPQHREFFLKKMGFGDEGGRAILSIMSALEKRGPGGQLTKVETAQLDKAMAEQTDNSTKMVQMLSAIKVGLIEVSNGLLGMIVAGIQMLVAFIKDPRHGGGQAFDRASELLGVFSEQVGSGFSKIGTGVGRGFGVFDQFFNNSEDRRRLAHTQAGEGVSKTVADSIASEMREEREKLYMKKLEERTHAGSEEILRLKEQADRKNMPLYEYIQQITPITDEQKKFKTRASLAAVDQQELLNIERSRHRDMNIEYDDQTNTVHIAVKMNQKDMSKAPAGGARKGGN